MIKRGRTLESGRGIGRGGGDVRGRLIYISRCSLGDKKEQRVRTGRDGDDGRRRLTGISTESDELMES